MRRFEEQFFKTLMIVATAIIVASFFLIIGTIVIRALPGLDWAIVTRTPEGGFYLGREGGILNAIVGSLYIAGGASLLALVVSIPIVLYLNLYLGGRSRFGGAARLSYDVLFGLPSIVYGAFGFAVMMLLGWRASLLAGIIVVTLLVMPIMIRTMDEVFRTLPRELADASYSLGATRFETARIMLRQAAPGIFTAVLLSFGRGIGDVASVMFTAGFSDNIPTGLDSPAATLPLAIFFQLSSPVAEVQSRAYAAALILTAIVLLISISARIATKRLSRHRV